MKYEVCLYLTIILCSYISEWGIALTGYVVPGCVEDGLGCSGEIIPSPSLWPSSPSPFGYPQKTKARGEKYQPGTVLVPI